MTQKKKNPSYRKISNEVKKAGGLKRATYAQVEHIYKLLMLKYVMSLEDQLKEDKAHLLLKQETIEELILDTRHKTNQIRRKNIAINRVSKINKYLYRDNFELTRAYNGLAQMGQFAEEIGVDIKKYNGQLPENNKWDFEQKHTLTETGKVKHQYRMKPKKKVQDD
tara:strand:- start:1931 stop:2428 length:498 start_codon:yes stop_codon:yes gene_type:complete